MIPKTKETVSRRFREYGVLVLDEGYPNLIEKNYIIVHNQEFYKRLKYDSVRGFIEGYINGEWTTDSMIGIMEAVRGIMEGDHLFKKGIASGLLSDLFSPSIEIPNILRSIDFFSKILDSRLTYSCGYWDSDNNMTLSMAQERKYDIISERAGIENNKKILDIGCGWGGFLGYVTDNYRVNITGISTSDEEIRGVRRNYDTDRRNITTIKTDLFNHSGNYDIVVGMGIFEYMKEDSYNNFFRKVSEYLDTNGTFVMETVIRNNRDRNWVLDGIDYLDEFMDTVGEFGTLDDIVRGFSDYFKLDKFEVLSGHYPKTLDAWIKNLLDAEDIPDTQKKIWEIYFNFERMAFKNNYLDPCQFVLKRK
jgi:cyclopropane-fatty-acyl-phospholipid synthase